MPIKHAPSALISLRPSLTRLNQCVDEHRPGYAAPALCVLLLSPMPRQSPKSRDKADFED